MQGKSWLSVNSRADPESPLNPASRQFSGIGSARRYGGYKLRELAAEVGGVDYTAISMALKRLDLRAAHDHQLAQVMEQVGNECDK